MASHLTGVMSSSTCSTTATNVFEIGKHITVLLRAEPGTCTTKSSLPVPPPLQLLIATPSEAGEFPLLLLLHGYLLYNSFYSQLIQHIASHGFIVLAPQLYTVAGPDSSEEIKSAAAVTNCLDRHRPGGWNGQRETNPPPVLTYVPHSFDLDMAVMVIGSGLGEVKRNPLFPPCAPKGVNHEDFFKECREPACYFLAKDYGHLDMLDDETNGIRGKATHCLCKNGKSREPMRRFVGGIVIAFMKAYLEGDNSSLISIRDGHATAPVELQKC
ncbi:Chlorophyllase-2, chloroplastic [Vitis vinifera]|uniref:Chlorophyllase-2, chloroplastic n=1 Tax=Vitis vinifera TaxID=29760 RepID=A0A438F757_VITVI|nr:Chlorophyllase-2, chloroplastic [Vitis vinifera]